MTFRSILFFSTLFTITAFIVVALLVYDHLSSDDAVTHINSMDTQLCFDMGRISSRFEQELIDRGHQPIGPAKAAIDNARKECYGK